MKEWGFSVKNDIVTHSIYQVTITPENFRRQRQQMLALLSQERLNTARVCRITPHTHVKEAKTVCVYREVRTVKGKFSTTDFLGKDTELYYRLVGKQNLPIKCQTGTIYLTNVRDIVLSIKQGNFNIGSNRTRRSIHRGINNIPPPLGSV